MHRAITAQIIKRCCRSIHNDDFLVIPAKQAGILPRKRNVKRQEVRAQNISLGSELEQNRESLSNDFILGSEVQEFTKNIETLRPKYPQVTEPELDRLRKTLASGYRNKQLVHYLKSNGIRCSAAHTKSQLVSFVLDRLWKVSSSGPQELKHATIPLSERDFVLIIGNNGSSLREWAKSGASIKIDATNHKLHIASSPQTFDWISASIHKITNNLKVEEIDLSEISKQIELSARDLMVIQYLSDTYLVHEIDKLIIYSRDHKSRALAYRLLLQLVPMSKWSSSSYLYDTNHEHIADSRFQQFYNMRGLPWMARGDRWFRWQAEQAEGGLPEYQKMDAVQFDENTPERGTLKELIYKELTKVIASHNVGSITATMGHLLHKVGNNTVLPNAGMQKTFDTNVPLVRTFAGQLSDYQQDLVQDFDTEMEMAMNTAVLDIATEPEESEDIGLLDSESKFEHETDLLELVKPQATMKRAEQGQSWNDYVLRVRLHPDCVEGSAALEQHPPIEVWVALQRNFDGRRQKIGIDMQNTVAVAAIHEHHTYVSLPGNIGDLRFTATESEVINDDGLTEFIEKIKCGTSEVLYVPAFAEIKGVKYAFIERSQITRAELNFKKNLLQLFSSEDGQIGGYRTEANLVLQDMSANAIEKFVEDSLDFVQKVESTPVMPISSQ